jgi:hypothetical protein
LIKYFLELENIHFLDVKKHCVQVLMKSPESFLEDLLIIEKSEFDSSTRVDIKLLYSFIELFLLNITNESQ